MARATWLFAATTIAGLATSAWLYFDRPRPAPAPECAPTKPVTEARNVDPWIAPARTAPARAFSAAPAPALPEQKDESRLARLEESFTTLVELAYRH